VIENLGMKEINKKRKEIIKLGAGGKMGISWQFPVAAPHCIFLKELCDVTKVAMIIRRI